MKRLNHPRARHFSFVALLVLVATAAGSGLALRSSTAWALPGPATAEERQIVLAVSMLMQQHLSGHALDDEISQRCVDTFLKSLDPLKLYFYQSDVDQFLTQRDQLDNRFRKGDIRFAQDVFALYVQRLDERIDMALAELDKQHDFSIDEEMIREPDARAYAKTPEEAAELWRKRVKYDLLNEIADDVTMEEAVEKLRKRYESIRKRWNQTSNDELLEIYLTSMTTGFDPHSDYMSPSTFENFNIMMRLELEGIGASLRSEDGYTIVHKIIPGGAADKQGSLKPEDKIVGVGQGTDGELEDVADMKLNDVVAKIRGKRGTVVRLEVIPGSGVGRQVYSITRDRIELKDSEARSDIIERGKKPDGTPYRIGVIQLPSFYMDMDGARLGLPNFKSTTRDVRRLLEEFKTKDVDLVMVDLRWNGGGSLTEAVTMTGLFIDDGPVVQVKGIDGRTQPYKDPEPGMVWDGPLVVVTNKFSASASEIFAGAIQDYGRGIVIGDKSTHGKGTVQQMFDLGNKLFSLPNKRFNWGSLKLTIQQFYRPSGDSTQNRGVLADVELPSLTEKLDVGEADLDYAMKFDQVQPLPHNQYYMVEPQLLEGLRGRSQQRVDASDYFTREKRRINRYTELKDRQTVTLNKDKFLAEREELSAEKEQEETFDKLTDPDRPVYELDGYGEEVLDISVDYLDLLGGNKVAVARPPLTQVP
jgi:carboxyl-terminal processing protease